MADREREQADYQQQEQARREQAQRVSGQEQQAGSPEQTEEQRKRSEEERKKLDEQNQRVERAKNLPPGQTELEPGVRVEKRPAPVVPVVRVAAEPAEDGVVIIDERGSFAGTKLAELKRKVAEAKQGGGDTALMDEVLAEAEALARGYRKLPDQGPRVEGPNPKDAKGQPSDEPSPETPIAAPADPAFQHESARRDR